MATDRKGLYDALRQLTPSLIGELAVTGAINIRDEIPAQKVRWCPTAYMIADALTKDSDAVRKAFTVFMPDPALSPLESTSIKDLIGGDSGQPGKWQHS